MKIYGLNDFYRKFYNETEGDEKTKRNTAADRALITFREQEKEIESFEFQIKLNSEPKMDSLPSKNGHKRYFYSAFGHDEDDNEFLVIFHTLFDGYSKEIDWDAISVTTYPDIIEIPKFILIK